MTRAANLAEAAGSGFAFRNRIINGDMRIDQRNAGASLSFNNNSVYSLDRWKVRYGSNGGTVGTCAVQQSTTAPPNFKNSLSLTVGTARTVISGDRFGVEQPIEGFNAADLGWGTAYAQPVTISFWVRSSLTGAFGLCLSNFSRGYAATYSISSANTWEYKTVTIPGDTSGTWVTDSGTGVIVVFDLGMGSDVRESVGSWQTGTFLGASGATNVVSTAGATFYITGVQLEKGATATPFENRLYGTELALCQRYYEVFNMTQGREMFVMQCASTTAANGSVTFRVPKRASPTAQVLSGTMAVVNASGAGAGGSLSFPSSNIDSAGLYISGASGLVAGNATWVYSSGSAGILGFSAEL